MRSCIARTASMIEPLERRQLLAAAPAGVFGGSILIDGTPHHAVVNLTDVSDNGLASGTFRIDDLGRYTFTASTTNGILSLIFTGARGSGSIVAKLDGGVSGQVSGQIDGNNISGNVRLHAPASASSTSGNAAVLIDASGIAAGNSAGVSGALGGTIQLRGEGLGPLGGGAPTGSATLDRRRLHAVLHIDDESTAGLFTGSFRMDRVGRYRFSGSIGADGTATVVFANGAGSGTIVADVGDVLSSGILTGGGGSASGKIFVSIGGREVHGIVRLNVSGSNAGGGGSNTSGLTVNGAPILTPPVERPPTPSTIVPGGTSPGSSFGATGTVTGSAGLTDTSNPFVPGTPTGAGSSISTGGSTMGGLFGETPIGGIMMP